MKTNPNPNPNPNHDRPADSGRMTLSAAPEDPIIVIDQLGPSVFASVNTAVKKSI